MMVIKKIDCNFSICKLNALPEVNSNSAFFFLEKTDEEISLGKISELATSEAVISLALDPEAIQRCLDGEQKTHKGFTFDIK